jgi:hypothetical protein
MKITLSELKTMALAAKPKLETRAAGENRCVKVYIHWSAAHYGQHFPDYHLMVDSDGSLYAEVDDLAALLAHTYYRNTGAVAMAAMAMFNATTVNFGPEPITDAQVETIAQVMAVLSESLQVPLDIQHFLTHAEAGDNLDGYNPGYPDPTGYPNNTYGPASNCERWDFWMLSPAGVRGSGGEILRGKANWYLAHPGN